jgi:mRNA interferase HigB
VNVVALRTLRTFWEKLPDARTPLRDWYVIVSHSEWSRPSDVKAAFGTSVDFVADSRVIFDIGRNKYRLVVRVSYRFKQVLIKFVGTHREYDRIDPEIV